MYNEYVEYIEQCYFISLTFKIASLKFSAKPFLAAWKISLRKDVYWEET